MGIVAQRNGIEMAGSTAHVAKEMVTTPLRRVGKLTVEIRVPYDLSAEQQERLRNAALSCPVHKSLHPDVQIPVTISFGKSAG